MRPLMLSLGSGTTSHLQSSMKWGQQVQTCRLVGEHPRIVPLHLTAPCSQGSRASTLPTSRALFQLTTKLTAPLAETCFTLGLCYTFHGGWELHSQSDISGPTLWIFLKLSYCFPKPEEMSNSSGAEALSFSGLFTKFKLPMKIMKEHWYWNLRLFP